MAPKILVQDIGSMIDALIRADIANWEGKEVFFDKTSPIPKANAAVYGSFMANKERNSMITKINAAVHGGPEFHFRNYHNY